MQALTQLNDRVLFRAAQDTSVRGEINLDLNLNPVAITAEFDSRNFVANLVVPEEEESEVVSDAPPENYGKPALYGRVRHNITFK